MCTSLIASQWGAYNSPTANFFLLPTRGWELAIGAIIAFYLLYRKHETRTFLSYKFIDETLGFIGLLMIGYAVYTFDETVPFPSFYALVPTVGTGLIILFSSPQTLSGRLLGTKPLVGIGLISYGTYLWHQPLFAFARHTSLTEPRDLFFLALAILSLLLGYLSSKYVERPFRKKEGISKKAVFLFVMIGSIAFIVIGRAGYITDGFPNRLTKSGLTLQYMEQKVRVNHGLSGTCEGEFTLSPDCRTSDNPEIVIWGDSYAMHLVPGIMVSNPDAKIIQMTKSACGPFFDVAPVSLPKHSISWAENCLEFTGEVHKWLRENSTVKYAVVSSPFGQYLSTNNTLLFRNGDSIDTNSELVIREFTKTLDELETMGITPVVFSPLPANGVNFGQCLIRAEWLGLNPDKCNFQVDDISQATVDVYAFLENIEENYRVIYLGDFICDDSLCETHFGSTFIFRDNGHLSHEGSAKLGEINDFYGLITSDYSNHKLDNSQ